MLVEMNLSYELPHKIISIVFYVRRITCGIQSDFLDIKTKKDEQ